MPRYVVHVQSPKPQSETFAYMADLSNFAKWDPGVVNVEQVAGRGAGPDAVFDVAVKSLRGPLTLRYHTTAFDPPDSVTARARSSLLTSLDKITVAPHGAGSVVTYDAVLELNGWLRFANPVLALAFKKIGDRAADGLIRVLGGERATGPAS